MTQQKKSNDTLEKILKSLKLILPYSICAFLILHLISSCINIEGYSQSTGKNAQKVRKNDWNEMNLQGPVKSLNEASFEAISRLGNIEKGDRKRQSYPDYDKFFIFDDKGNIIVKEEYEWDDKLFTKTVYQFSGPRDTVEINTYNRERSLITRFVQLFDKKGNIIETISYGGEGDYRRKSTYHYDDLGNCIKTNEYNSDGKFSYYSVYQYDNSANMIESEDRSADGTLNYRTSFEYDNKNNMTKKTYEYRFDGANWSCIYKYDDMGNVIEETLSDNIGKSKIITSTIAKKYTFDKMRNWVKLIETINERPVSIIERKIEYFTQEDFRRK